MVFMLWGLWCFGVVWSAAFAGKPAPTGSVVAADFAADTNPVGARLARDGRASV
jgi:hypothetical protein